jgi:hypothetical protein
LSTFAGPDGIEAGQQISISYGAWPAEPFLLLFGFVPQPNPYDSIIVHSNLQHMAACYLQCLAGKLQAQASSSGTCHNEALLAAQNLVADDSFSELVKQRIADIEMTGTGQEPHQGEGGAPQAAGGFNNMTVEPRAVDPRLKVAHQMVQSVIADAAAQLLQQYLQAEHAISSSSSIGVAQQCPTDSTMGTGDTKPASQAADEACKQLLQLSLSELLVHTLEDLSRRLQQAVEVAEGCRGGQQQPSQDKNMLQPSATAADLDGGSSSHPVGQRLPYSASSSHAALVHAYCSSKLALAEQLANGYPIRIAGVDLLV